MSTLYDQRRPMRSGQSSGHVQNDGLRNNNDNSSSSSQVEDDGETMIVRDIHALTTSPENRSHSLRPPPPRGYFNSPARSSDVASSAGAGENFTSISREFNALVIAGSSMDHYNSTYLNDSNNSGNNNNYEEERNYNYQEGPGRSSSNQVRDLMTRIGEDEEGPEVPEEEETNLLAIVPDGIGPSDTGRGSATGADAGSGSVHRVRREEVETKIMAWQNAKLAKINNRFKREDAVITGWENEQVHKASSWMKKVERKLEERRARAIEKMENDVARARRKAEERRATAEGKRGTEVAKVLEVANLMRAVGRPPSKRSFFSFH